jgi:DNA-binding MarR family transcriptional regulator
LWWLIELEHEFTGSATGEAAWFFHSNEDLAEHSGLSVSSVKRAKEELKRKGLIEMRQIHFQDRKTKKRSTKHITDFRILV